MKYVLNAFLIFSITPAFALCPIDSNESVCTLPNAQQNGSLLFQNNTNQTNKTQNMLQPRDNSSSANNMLNNNKNLQRNPNCMFGTCLNDLKNTQESSFK